VLYFVSSVTLIISSYKVLLRRRKGALPPGPRPWPIAGNIPHLPDNREWETYDKWAKEYGKESESENVNLSLFDAMIGPIVSLSLGILGDPMIIINNFDVAKDLMNGRSANSADRPFPIIKEVYVLH